MSIPHPQVIIDHREQSKSWFHFLRARVKITFRPVQPSPLVKCQVGMLCPLPSQSRTRQHIGRHEFLFLGLQLKISEQDRGRNGCHGNKP